MNRIDHLLVEIQSPAFREKLEDIYRDTGRIPREIMRYGAALEEFRALFGDVPVAVFSAPGRTEIGGNHTDHQHGQVLAASINDDAIAVAAPRTDGVIRVQSQGYPLITLTLPETCRKAADLSAAAGDQAGDPTAADDRADDPAAGDQAGDPTAAGDQADDPAAGDQADESSVSTYSRTDAPTEGLPPLQEEEGTTRGLIRGMAAGLLERGYRVGGFDAYITSEVLGGSGLSSSAAFETLIGTILSGLYNDMSVDAVTIAKIGQYAENVYFGKPCGLMDQMACSVGSLCFMDFADPEDPKIQRVDFDLAAADFCLCITDTRGSHADLTPDYAAVPAEMKAVAAHFGKDVLREVPEDDFRGSIPALRAELGDRPILRAIHFYEENRRAAAEAAALGNGDMEGFLRSVRASGESSFKFLQNVYTGRDVQHQNVSLALAVSESVLGLAAGPDSLSDTGVARVHGGGFAGTIQAFVPARKADVYRTAMDTLFGSGACMVLQIRKYGGIRVL